MGGYGDNGGGGRGNCLIWALSIPSHITGWYLNQHIVQNIINLTDLPTNSFLQRMPYFIFVLAGTVNLLINLYMRHPASCSENCWAIAYLPVMKTTSMDNSMNERSDCVAAKWLFSHFSYFWWLLSNLVIYILVKLSLRRLLLIGDDYGGTGLPWPLMHHIREIQKVFKKVLIVYIIVSKWKKFYSTVAPIRRFNNSENPLKFSDCQWYLYIYMMCRLHN